MFIHGLRVSFLLTGVNESKTTQSFCLHTVKCQNSSISNNSVKHKYTD